MQWERLVYALSVGSTILVCVLIAMIITGSVGWLALQAIFKIVDSFKKEE